MVFHWMSVAWAGTLVLGADTVVVVTDVAPTDPAANTRGALLGELCAVGAKGLSSSGDGWWAGDLRCADGQVHSLRSVAVAVPGTAVLPAALRADAVAKKLGSSVKFPSDRVAVPPAAGPAAAPAVSSPPVGTEAPAGPDVVPHDALVRAAGPGEAVRIVALSPDDAFYQIAGQVVGRNCYPTETMRYHGDGWQGGPIACWDGETYFFYKVALAPDPSHTSLQLPSSRPTLQVPDTRAEPGTPPPVVSADLIRDGARVQIQDISATDGYFGEKGALVGRRCKVKGALTPDPTGDWFGGGVTCGSRYLYFYQVRVSRL